MVHVDLGEVADGGPLAAQVRRVAEHDDVGQVPEAHVARAQRHHEVDEAGQRRTLVRQQTQHHVVPEAEVPHRLLVLQGAPRDSGRR